MRYREVREVIYGKEDFENQLIKTGRGRYKVGLQNLRQGIMRDIKS